MDEYKDIPMRIIKMLPEYNIDDPKTQDELAKYMRENAKKVLLNIIKALDYGSLEWYYFNWQTGMKELDYYLLIMDVYPCTNTYVADYVDLYSRYFLDKDIFIRNVRKRYDVDFYINH